MNLPADWKKLDDSEIVNRLKSSADVSAEVLTALAGSDDWEVRRAVAWHDNTPELVLRPLAEDDDSDVRQALGDRSLPREWRYRSQDEKISALQSDQVEEDIIEALASSENWSLRQAVAWSPSTSDAVMSRLKEDDDEDVQFAASQEQLLSVEWRFLPILEKVERLAEQSVDESILNVLARSRSTDLRRSVALHPSTSQLLLNKLAVDDDANVQSGIRERQLPNQWKALDDDDRIAALREPGLPENVLVILSGSGNCLIRQGVALSPSAPDSVLERLANDEDIDVQSAVHERDLPAEWKILDEDEKIERLNEGPVDATILEILARSGRWAIRQAVAENSGIAETTLQDLLQDDDDDVQSAASKNLEKRGAGARNDDENHSIYIKTEPGGRIAFGALDLDQIQQLQESIATRELASELEDLRYNSNGSLNECDGVVNSGDEGDFGNEGTIVLSANQPTIGPSLKDDGSFEDGVYIVWMRLSKCSIEFEFNARGGFDKDEFEEISVPVKLPDEIVHGLYGHPDFNIITGFRFRGEPVSEYEGEVEDRGYEDQLMFFAIKAGEVTVMYRNYNDDEEWCDEDKAKTVL